MSESSVIRAQLLMDFLPDDLCPLGAQFFEVPGQTLFGKNHKSVDKVNSSTFSVEDDTFTETSETLADMESYSGIDSNLLSVNQLLESVTETYRQVERITVSAPDLPFKEMTNRCEALLVGKFQKLSVFVAAQQILEGSIDVYSTKQSACIFGNELHSNGENPNACSQEISVYTKPTCVTDIHQQGQCLRLPAFSPYDNFLKAAGY